MDRRPTLLLSAITMLPMLCAAQSTSIAYLDINDVKALFMPHGMIARNPGTSQADYAVPAMSGRHPLYAASLWIGGVDASQQLHLAALKYDQQAYPDFAPGPLTVDGSAAISSTISLLYDRIWKIDAADVAEQQAYFNCLATPGCDPAVEFPGYSVPAEFYQWPAQGDLQQDQAPYLAPFIDHDNDGTYDPDQGDAPCIQGDQALFFIYNDKLHTHASGGLPIGVEVQAMPFAFSSASAALDQTVFLKYHVIDRGTLTLQDTYLGLFTDFDLGNSTDDFIGCDPARNLWYVYNADNDDETVGGTLGYGLQPPAFGAVLLQGPFMDANAADDPMDTTLPAWNGTGFGDGANDNERLGLTYARFYDNTSGATGDPMTAGAYFNYLRGLWADNSPQLYGGDGHISDPDADPNTPAHFAYPNDTDPVGAGTGGMVQPAWSETSANNLPADRRMLGNSGPFTLEPGEEFDLVYALVYARAGSGGPFASVAALQQRVDSVRAFWQQLGDGCNGQDAQVGLRPVPDPRPLHLYPSPCAGLAHLDADAELAGVALHVQDALGRTVLAQVLRVGTNTIDLSGLAPGAYTCEAVTGQARRVGRLVKE
ncbi:MAG: T9SS type A sorting domain-containing protein [Flavobacteriales bacterium]|nr:T9SS type A sorting domain-containing protein [Flavobacteriales bacterium]MCB9193954.1 T9SS type A sorting domain-containing protein [Flavobacteriales bacterium]